MNNRREFLRRAVTLGAAGFFMAGCKAADSVTQIVGSDSRVGSWLRVGQAVAKTFEDYTPEQEYYLGRTVGAMALDKYPPFEDGPANAYVNVLGQALAAGSDRPETFGGYRFQVMDSPEINAFAAPGGFVFVTRGLVRCCPDEDALAGVLAHEIAHVQENHGLRAIKQSRVTEALTLAGREGAKQFGSAELGALTRTFGDSIADITRTMIVSGYSRAQELEADRGAVQILTRVGYHPGGLVRMLEEMEGRLKPGTQDFAKTHPSPGDRIAALKAAGGEYPSYVLPRPRKLRFAGSLARV